MKRLVVLFIALNVIFYLDAQNITDGLRYSKEEIFGTARYNSLSGAFGALGGDLSAISTNPAGSAIFLNNYMAMSFGVSDHNNDSNYFNSDAKGTSSNFNFNQFGGVFVFNNHNESSNFNKFVLGLNLEANSNYHDLVSVTGTGNKSIADYFLLQAQGISLDLLQLQSGETISDLYAYLGSMYGTGAQNAFLGYQGFIIDPVDPTDPDNTEYISNIASGVFDHYYDSYEDGFKAKFTVNFATQYKDDYYFGVNLNSHVINFDQTTFLSERNSNPGSLVNMVNFENNLSVTGSGLSAQIGAIMKLFEKTRIGFTLDTPTWYVISEETSQYLKTNRIENGNSISEVVNPYVVNVFEDYDLRTPGRLMVSIAHIFGKKGLISFDYSFKDYSSIQFGPKNDPYFASENTNINNELKGASSYRIGGEYRFLNYSFRGGFNYEESPYKEENKYGGTSGFSLGFGYDMGRFNFDLAYTNTNYSRSMQLYSIGLTDSANVDTTINNIIFTLGLDL